MVAQLVKSIKPKKLDIDQIRLNLLNALRAEGQIIAKEFDKTTATWEGEKPKFEVLIGLTGTDATVVVGPTGSDLAVNKWTWLDKGTKKNYPIEPKRAPKLIFQSGYKAKTRVNTFSSSGGGPFGPTVGAKKVIHPGIKARNWSVLIIKRRKKRFTKAMIEAARIV
jgi:hypothetical protein